MMKIKLLTTVLIVLSAVGIVTAAEVINVDIKGFGDNTPYIGNGAYDVGNGAVWIPYYGGWGVPVGSSRTEALVPSTVPLLQQYLSSVYAAQVWIGDNGQKHGYQLGSGLMDDGFTAVSPNEPDISIWGQGAYTGRYDIYVYGDVNGNFILDQNVNGTFVQIPKGVTGGVAPGTFTEGGNYVIFADVNITNANSNDLYLTYTSKLSALQLVKKKSPFVIEPNALSLIRIPAGDWDVAGERNTRTTEPARFGPDTWFDDGNGIGRVVGYLDSGEFMDYDITVNAANEGQYQISLGVMGGTSGYINAASMYIWLDGRSIGEVNLAAAAPAGNIGETTKVTANLFAGSHTVGWFFSGYAGTNTGFSLADVNFVRIGNLSVGLTDLDLLVNNWLICNDPNGCF